MAKGSNVGGTRRKVLSISGFLAVVTMFLLYMVPFVLVLLNSFKQKRDIIKNPFSFVVEKGYSIENYVKAFDKMDFIKAFGNSLFITGLSTILVIVLASMTADYGVIMAALVLTVAPLLLLYLFLQKHIIDGVVAGAVKS